MARSVSSRVNDAFEASEKAKSTSNKKPGTSAHTSAAYFDLYTPTDLKGSHAAGKKKAADKKKADAKNSAVQAKGNPMAAARLGTGKGPKSRPNNGKKK